MPKGDICQHPPSQLAVPHNEYDAKHENKAAHGCEDPFQTGTSVSRVKERHQLAGWPYWQQILQRSKVSASLEEHSALTHLLCYIACYCITSTLPCGNFSLACNAPPHSRWGSPAADECSKSSQPSSVRFLSMLSAHPATFAPVNRAATSHRLSPAPATHPGQPQDCTMPP